MPRRQVLLLLLLPVALLALCFGPVAACTCMIVSARTSQALID
jgi:hypothetical protein